MSNSIFTSSLITEQIKASIDVKHKLLNDTGLLIQILGLASACRNSLQAGGKIIFAGNGGSFADSQHLAAEFTSRFRFEREPLAAMALGTNSSAMSAIANDYGFENVFCRELAGIAKKIDVFIPISTSGNSQNIVNAIDQAKQMNLHTVALTGRAGGEIHKLCESLRIPSDDTARIQECHILVGHIVCELVEESLFNKMLGK